MSRQANKVVSIKDRRIEKIQNKARQELPKIVEEISCLHYGLGECLREGLEIIGRIGLFDYDVFEMIGRLQVLTKRMGDDVNSLFEEFCGTDDDDE